MRMHWWQSIRWRLALGSMLVVLLATVLLALSVMLAILHYYGTDQSQQLANLATVNSQRIGINFVKTHNLSMAAQYILSRGIVQSHQGEEYVLIVLNHRNQVVYPQFNSRVGAIRTFIVALADPALGTGSFKELQIALRNGQQGKASPGEIGQSGPGVIPRPFVVQPIFLNGQQGAPVEGVVVIVSRSTAENTIPPFLAAVGQPVLVASVIIVILAALAALLFSRTITRPLARLTRTAHVLASGDYSAQVKTPAQGEIGELADTFNKMAARLASDVNELRQQELWRRELIMNITHDLATPLTAITGLGESLVDGVNQSYEDYEATGRIIVRETLRLRRLVKDLHIMAKVEAHALQPQWRAVRLAALVDEVLAVLAPEFERRDVEPVNNIAYSLPIIQADPDMLMRVFSNLCDNALRYTPAGGMVTIDAIERDNQLVVSVTDSGEGIPADALARIFDRFYRADASRQAISGGSGLGLAIVHAIIEVHRGTIRAENAPDSGARFIFTLPLGFSEATSISSAITMPIR